MHALEVIAYRHPDEKFWLPARGMYAKMVSNMHLNIETHNQMIERLSEDRFLNNTVIS